MAVAAWPSCCLSGNTIWAGAARPQGGDDTRGPWASLLNALFGNGCGLKSVTALPKISFPLDVPAVVTPTVRNSLRSETHIGRICLFWRPGSRTELRVSGFSVALQSAAF